MKFFSRSSLALALLAFGSCTQMVPLHAGEVDPPPAIAAVDVIAAITAPFAPVFEQGVVISTPWGVSYPVNPFYFATSDTAATACRRLLCSLVIERPCGEVGAGFGCSAPQRFLLFDATLPRPFEVNAGLVAAYYWRNREDEHPGVADALVNAELAKIRALFRT